MLDPAVCYRALRTRDARFDGRFFVTVTSTGVYCRPVCPARTPRRENCRFVACAAAAQEAGFRPCLRCRPEASPGTPAWLGTSVTVSRALRLIAQGALDTGSLGALSDRLGVGERHLRRLFIQHLGASPIAVAQNRRILFAKKLIDETSLPMTKVALAAGFSSVRRFNDALRSTYAVTPSLLRRRATRGGASPAPSEIVLRLAFRPPLDWEGLLQFLGRRAIPGVESVEGEVYRRTISLDGAFGRVEVSRDERHNQLRARIQLDDPSVLQTAAERLRQLFDLGADPAVIEDHLGRDRRLRRILRAHPGLRVPGAWDGFELAVRAILGQQVSVAGATTLAGRLASTFGRPLAAGNAGGATSLLFPEPERLAEAEIEVIGLPRARAEAIRSLARAVASGALRFDGGPGLEAIVDALVSLPGVGPWTAHYVAMRALREPDAFPASDLGLRRALSTNGKVPHEREVLRRAEAWRPWRAYAAMALWSDSA